MIISNDNNKAVMTLIKIGKTFCIAIKEYCSNIANNRKYNR